MVLCNQSFKDSSYEKKYIGRHKLGSNETLRLLFVLSIFSIIIRAIHDLIELFYWNKELVPKLAWRFAMVLLIILVLFGFYRFIFLKIKFKACHSELTMIVFIAGGFAAAFFGFGSSEMTNPSPNAGYWEGVNVQFYALILLSIFKQQSSRLVLIIANTTMLIAYRARNAGDGVNIINTVGFTLLLVFIIIISEKYERTRFLEDFAKEKNFMKILDAMPESVIVLDREKRVVFANDSSQVIFNPNEVTMKTNEAREKSFEELCSKFKHLKLRDLFASSKVKLERSKTVAEGAAIMEDFPLSVRPALVKRETIRKVNLSI